MLSDTGDRGSEPPGEWRDLWLRKWLSTTWIECHLSGPRGVLSMSGPGERTGR
jgi:hypothetical protein